MPYESGTAIIKPSVPVSAIPKFEIIKEIIEYVKSAFNDNTVKYGMPIIDILQNGSDALENIWGGIALAVVGTGLGVFLIFIIKKGVGVIIEKILSFFVEKIMTFMMKIFAQISSSVSAQLMLTVVGIAVGLAIWQQLEY